MGNRFFRGVQIPQVGLTTHTQTQLYTISILGTHAMPQMPGPHLAAESMNFTVLVISCLIKISISRTPAKPDEFLKHNQAQIKGFLGIVCLFIGE